MARGHDRSGYGFSPSLLYPTDYPRSYSSGNNYVRGQVTIHDVYPRQPPQPAPYQRYQQPHPYQHSYPVPDDYATRSYVPGPSQPRGRQSHPAPQMGCFPSSPERSRRPAVRHEHVYRDPVEDFDAIHLQSPRHRAYRTRTARPRTPPPQSRSVAPPRAMYSEDPGEGSSSAAPPAESGPRRHRPATEEDAVRHGIPANYQLGYWDPTEEPIYLLGCVFDANSLGKWIYDWTVAQHDPQAPFSEVAYDLWLLLLRLTGNINRANEYLRKGRDVDDQAVLEDFIDSGRRQMTNLQRLLRACEEQMLHRPQEGQVLGDESAIEFVNTIFGRDGRLQDTEQFMQDIELWLRRWEEHNCESILKRRRRRH